jgi:glycosyltransferase involved in cell wall biosynthesis
MDALLPSLTHLRDERRGRTSVANVRVTVLIASHNRLPLLQPAVASALSQDHPEVDVLVVDDGSDQETRSWLRAEAAREPRLRVLFEPHRGVAAARTRGIEVASGDLICVLDSDDLLDSDAVSRMVRLFEEHPETDLAYANIRELGKGGRPRDQAYPRFGSNRAMIWATLLRPRVPFKHSGTTFRRTTALELGSYDPSLPLKVDIDLFLRFLSRGKQVQAIGGRPLVTFRVHADSMSRGRLAGIKAWFLLIDRYSPHGPSVRAAIKAVRAGSELLKAAYVTVLGV